jgi:metal-responsive CopG/Arc/MetJ family transcriptional regulator
MKYTQIIEVCCRDLRRYLEYAVQTTRGGVITVKMNRVAQIAPPPLGRRRYSRCLGDVLRPWRWNTGVYVVPRRDAEELLSRFDEFCTSVRNKTATVHSQRPAEAARRINTAACDRGDAGGEMVPISFHVTPALMQILDEYARRMNQTRSDVVRTAIRQLIEKYRNAEADLQRPAALAAPPTAQEDELVAVTFHETPYVVELLNRYAAALGVSRSDVVSTAIQQLLDRIRVASELA